jgi:hypothetical protein
MVLMRKMNHVCVFNPIEAKIWLRLRRLDVLCTYGDPVHCTPKAYEALAGRMAEKVCCPLTKSQATSKTLTGKKMMAEPRDYWMEESQLIA